jgi:sugar/nucleoside kinase (ribokinase family)
MSPGEPALPPEGSRGYDVICIGHALVDRLRHATPEELTEAGLRPAAMTLVDEARARLIEGAHDDWQECAGGSAANTAVAVASFGGTAAFCCSVGDDDAGRRYVADLEASGVRCVPEVVEQLPTGVCHVFYEANGERSMATMLGAAGSISEEAVETAGVGQASLLYLEGYLFDAPSAERALERAVSLAGGAGTALALSLSDPFVVERHRDVLARLVRSGAVSVLFGNEEEALCLSGASSLEGALQALSRDDLLLVVTRGPAGSVGVIGAGPPVEAPAWPAERVVDTTGAGDLFAAGVLHGLSRRLGVESSLCLGAVAAAEVISHVGARPDKALSALAAACN